MGLNQTAFGERIGVTATAISKLEKGERNITEQMVLAICREFNVNEEWLRSGEGSEAAMFVLHNDKEIAALCNAYSMDENSIDVITGFCKLPALKREALSALIKDYARIVVQADFMEKPDTEFADDAPPLHMQNMDELDVAQAIIDKQRAADVHYGKGGNAARSG